MSKSVSELIRESRQDQEEHEEFSKLPLEPLETELPPSVERGERGNQSDTSLPNDIGNLLLWQSKHKMKLLKGGDDTAVNKWERLAIHKAEKIPFEEMAATGVVLAGVLHGMRRYTFIPVRRQRIIYGMFGVGLYTFFKHRMNVKVQNSLLYSRQSTIGFQARTLMRAKYPEHSLLAKFDKINPGLGRALRAEKDRRGISLDNFKVEQILYEINELNPEMGIDLDNPMFRTSDVLLLEAKVQERLSTGSDFDELVKSLDVPN
eukprot:494177_1